MQDKGEDQACAGWQSANHLRRLAVMVHSPLHMSGGAPFRSCTPAPHPPHLPDGVPFPPLTSCVAWPTLSLAWPMVSWAEWVICWAVWLILSPAWVMASWALCMAFLALSMVAAGGAVAGNGCVTLVGTCQGVRGGSGAHVHKEERFRLGDNCMLTAADAATQCACIAQPGKPEAAWKETCSRQKVNLGNAEGDAGFRHAADLHRMCALESLHLQDIPTSKQRIGATASRCGCELQGFVGLEGGRV